MATAQQELQGLPTGTQDTRPDSHGPSSFLRLCPRILRRLGEVVSLEDGVVNVVEEQANYKELNDLGRQFALNYGIVDGVERAIYNIVKANPLKSNPSPESVSVPFPKSYLRLSNINTLSVKVMAVTTPGLS